MARAGGKSFATSSTSPEHTLAVSHIPMFQISTSVNLAQSVSGRVCHIFAVSNVHPVTVVPVKTPEKAISTMSPNGSSKKSIMTVLPCPTESIPPRFSAVMMTMKAACSHPLASGEYIVCIVRAKYVTKSPGYSAVSTAEKLNCSHPAIPPAPLPKAALAHRTNPPFSGYIVESSVVMSASGTANTTPSTMIPRKVTRGPAVFTIVSVPSGPPATEKYMMAMRDSLLSFFTRDTALLPMSGVRSSL
mmetsp:Transcript_39318/g.96773  ORF Transcript_39318/g.96773 Transcript_39318/m.96773 type:complete len:246 (-) Transcript_39318:103-840(-)